MLIFFKARLCLLAVPKTGSTAYHAALAACSDMAVCAPPELKHAPVYRYNRFFRPMFDRVCDAQIELCAVVREPVSWLGSWYRYRQRPEKEGQPVSTRGLSFDAFVTDYLKGKRPAHADVGSQSKFLEPQPSGMAVAHLFAYERLDRFDAFLSERLGIEVSTGRANVSPDLPLQLSPGIEKRLRRKCAAEFDLHASIEE